MSLSVIYRGDTVIIDGAVTTPLGFPQDLTDCKLWFTAKRSERDIYAVIALSTDTDDIVITDVEGGLFVILLLPEVTDSLSDITNLCYDVQIRDALDRIYTIKKGTLRVMTDVTRSIE